MAAVSLFVTLLLLVVSDYNENSHLPLGVHGVLGSSPDLEDSDFLVRNTMSGKVRGTLRTLHFLGGQRVERYLGIPYASPPVGDLRFEFPVPPEPWEGVRDAHSVPKACPQATWDLRYVQMHVPEFKNSDMDEDCLYLNVYVPATKPDRKEEEKKEEDEDEGGLPVLIHVHGGSNEVGMGAMFHGDVLASLADVIVVTFNYRLGFFGFLSGHSSELPGNFGLRDQAEAFRWVSKNIHQFGGDPRKVTIQGHSAGGNDVGQHVLSPLSKGLFRHVVMMSGSPLAYWAIYHSPESGASTFIRKFLQKMGCQQLSGVKSCLKGKSWQNINSARTYYATPGIIGHAPVVDGLFIPMSPEKALRELPLNGEVFMTGVTGNEGSLTAQMVQKHTEKYLTQFRFNENFTKEYHLRPFDAFGTGVPNFGRLIYQEYKAWHDPYNTTADLISVSRIMGDPTFVAPAVKVAEAISAREEDMYFYSFNHVSRLSSDPPWMGVPHGRDLFYLFGCPLSGHPLYHYTELDKNVSRALIDMWANFIRYGRPFQTSEPDVFLPTFETRNQSYFVITSDGSDVRIHTDQRPRSRQVSFWNSLLPKLRLATAASLSEATYKTLTWVFVALTSALLVMVLVLSMCVIYFRKLARDRCVVHATDEKNSCSV